MAVCRTKRPSSACEVDDSFVKSQGVEMWPAAAIVIVGIQFTWDVSQVVSEAEIEPSYLLLPGCSGSTNPSAKHVQVQKSKLTGAHW